MILTDKDKNNIDKVAKLINLDEKRKEKEEKEVNEQVYYIRNPYHPDNIIEDIKLFQDEIKNRFNGMNGIVTYTDPIKEDGYFIRFVKKIFGYNNYFKNN